jgi:hypothetical protein
MDIIEHNIETGEIVKRIMTKSESSELEAMQKSAFDKETTKENQKTAILEKLGLTADEAAVLLS